MKKLLIAVAIVFAVYGGCVLAFGKGATDNTIKKGCMYTMAGVMELCDWDHDYEVRYDGVLWGSDHYVYVSQRDADTGKETGVSKCMQLEGNLLLSE